MKASKVLTVSVSVFRGRQFCGAVSLSKNNISPAAPDLELILFPLWYWPIMKALTKQQQDKVFETDFTDSQKSEPPFAHLLALNHSHDNLCFRDSFAAGEGRQPCHPYHYTLHTHHDCHDCNGGIVFCARSNRAWLRWNHSHDEGKS